MTEWGRDDLRRFVTHVLDAFVAALDQQYAGKPIPAAELRRIAGVVENSPALLPAINATYERIKKEAAKEFVRNRRVQPFKRLVVHPLTELFEDGALHRDILPNYFNFFHLVLGDETEALSRLAVTICKDERHEDGVDWDHFYEDERAKFVLWTCLVRIAASFKKFEQRREWFITLMQNRQQAASLASNAFVPLSVDNQPEEPRPFGREQFNALFAALYGPLRKLNLEDEAHFAEAMQTTPEQAFGEMWANLERNGAQF